MRTAIELQETARRAICLVCATIIATAIIGSSVVGAQSLAERASEAMVQTAHCVPAQGSYV